MKKADETWIDKLLWWLLNKSRIFRYLFKRFLTQLNFELERFDLEPEEIKRKYRQKLQDYS